MPFCRLQKMDNSMNDKDQNQKPESEENSDKDASLSESVTKAKVPEDGGPKGPEPTRYGDWEKKGRCIDF